MGPILFDEPMLRLTQAFHPAWFTAFMRTVSFVFSPYVTIATTVVLASIVMVRRRYRHAFFLLLIAAGNILTPVIKMVFERQRPEPTEALLLAHERSFGFPSGHAVAIVLACAAVLFVVHPTSTIIRQRVVVFALLLTFLVGVSRVYLGVHWPTDVLGGYVIAAAWLVIARWLVKARAAWRGPISSA